MIDIATAIQTQKVVINSFILLLLVVLILVVVVILSLVIIIPSYIIAIVSSLLRNIKWNGLIIMYLTIMSHLVRSIIGRRVALFCVVLSRFAFAFFSSLLLNLLDLFCIRYWLAAQPQGQANIESHVFESQDSDSWVEWMSQSWLVWFNFYDKKFLRVLFDKTNARKQNY